MIWLTYYGQARVTSSVRFVQLVRPLVRLDRSVGSYTVTFGSVVVERVKPRKKDRAKPQRLLAEAAFSTTTFLLFLIVELIDFAQFLLNGFRLNGRPHLRGKEVSALTRRVTPFVNY